jgi:hypothetical protein
MLALLWPQFNCGHNNAVLIHILSELPAVQCVQSLWFLYQHVD